MKHLLDVNLLLAAIWTSHPHHAKACAWLPGRQLLLCPLAELGFLRISTNKKALGVPMADARKLLAQFATDYQAERIPADLKAMDSHPNTSDQVTDHYLADLAVKHGSKLATFDAGIKHSGVDLVT